jgi:acetyl esterase/lipase
MLLSCTTPAGENGRGSATDAARAADAVTPTRSCPAESVRTATVHTASDQAYVTREGRALRFDVAWSDTGPPAPLVLLLHGGGWSGGSRSSMHEEMLALARRGYTAATADYRLTQTPSNVFPAAVSDVRCALRALRRRAAEFHLAPDRVGLAGYSAGAHLASLIGVGADVRGLGDPGCDAPDATGRVRDADDRVQAVISYAGPQDLRVNGPYTQEQADLVTNFLGVFPGDAPAVATLASPIAQVSQGDPPFLLLHGTDDPLVPVNHPRRMADALRNVGTPATLLELRGIGHGFVGFVTSSNATVRCTVESFLERWLRQDA